MSFPSFSFRSDERGRIAERILNFGGEPETRRYAYDSAGRLARVTDGANGLLEPYQYDREGRRLADINLSPYEESLFFIIIVYKKGVLFEKINMAWIPTDQGILEHLKARGVKVWNFWFWQEE